MSIWRDFASDLGYAACKGRLNEIDGACELGHAEDWADKVCDQLAASYGLEDWDNCDDD